MSSTEGVAALRTGRFRYRLSQRFVTNISNKPTGSKRAKLFPDGDGLYLVVEPTGAARWMFRYRFNKKRRDMGLGPLRDVPLIDARATVATCRMRLREGIDPVVARSSVRASRLAVPTFETLLKALVESKRAGWKSEKHAAQWLSSLENHAGRIMKTPVDLIGTDEILTVLEPIWTTIPETASRVRGRIEQVLDAAIAKKLRPEPNPARWTGSLEYLLASQSTLTRGHMPALPWAEMPDFMAKLRKRKGVAARALEWGILAATRPNETRGACDAEIAGDEWTIPPERMKSGKQHVVPLSGAAMAMLKTLPETGLLFRGPRGGELSDAAMNKLIQDMGYKGRATAHGFRSSFRDWAGDNTTHEHQVAEMALAHIIKDKTEAAYRRGLMLNKRRALMEDWAAFLAGNTQSK